MAEDTKTRKITDAEWDVMDVVWDDNPITAQDVAKRLQRARGWTETTVKTLLARLVQKGALMFQRDGKRFLYQPALSRQNAVARESRTFLDRVFRGEATPLLSHFVKHGKLSASEIAVLRKMLDEREGKR